MHLQPVAILILESIKIKSTLLPLLYFYLLDLDETRRVGKVMASFLKPLSFGFVVTDMLASIVINIATQND